MRIVVEGCGQWAMQYFEALKTLAREHGVGIFFTYDSTFGLDAHAERLRAPLFLEYLQATLRNVQAIQAAGFACVDVKDTLFKLQRKPHTGRAMLPHNVDAVFIVTPDRTHCDVAEYWLGRAKWVFVEKPFDFSVERIEQFCQKLSEQNNTRVFGVDHYFVRCNHVATDEHFFLSRLLSANSAGNLQGDFTSFEFRMTEPPVNDNRAVRERALSLQGGMVFDLGAHALPMLLPFIDIGQSVDVTDVRAGVSNGLRDIIFSGAETASTARVRCSTRATATKPSTQRINGKFMIGKDIGERPEKYLLIQGPAGKVWFDLVHYYVYHEGPDGHKKPVVPLHQNWAQFFVKEVFEGRIPKAVEQFKAEGALKVVGFLRQWRDACQPKTAGPHQSLPGYKPGAAVSDLESGNYRIMRGGELL